MSLTQERITKGKIARKLFGVAILAAFCMTGIAAVPAQAPSQGVARTLAETKTAQDDDVKCLVGALENGDPDKGASTWILKAPPGCVVAKHFHTAEEQLMVVSGEVRAGMDGMREKH